MTAIEQKIWDILTDARDQIRDNMQHEGVNASGQTSDSIQVRKTDGGFELVGGGENAAPVETLEIGRPAGKVPYNFAEIIAEWCRIKGVNANPWAIVTNIRKKGTIRHREQSERKDIYSSVAKETAKRLHEELVNVLCKTISTGKTNF